MNVARADLSATAAGIAVFQLTLVSDADGFESFVRMPTNAAFFVTWRKGVWRGVVQQEEGAQLASMFVIVEDRANREAIADPMSAGTLMDSREFLYLVSSTFDH